MLKFLQFIKESTYSSLETLNKSQRRAINRHPDYTNYIYSHEHPTLMRPDDRDRPDTAIRNLVIANREGKHRMHVAITTRGQILNADIYRRGNKTETGHEWHHVKSS